MILILSSEINSVDEFKFTIYPTHPYFENISKLSSIVTVYRDDKLIFKGRVITCEYGFHNEKSVTCEGVLAFLLDTFIRPFDFPNNEQFEDLNYKQDNVIEYFLNWVLKCHNEQAKNFQKIKLGTVSDASNVKTGIIPLGARLEDDEGTQTDKYLTIEDLPDEVLSDGIIKSGDYIINTSLSEKYGAIYETVKWDDVKIAENLQKKALSYIADSVKIRNSITIKAIDLRLTDEQIGAFTMGQYVRCFSSPHGIDDLYLLQKLEIDMKNPQNTTIQLDYSTLSFTDKVVENKKHTDNIVTRIDRVERGYINNGSVRDIANETVENSSAFEQNSKAIMSQVAELYTKVTDFETYKSDISTQFTQTNQDFTYQFNTLIETINNLDSNSSSQFNNIIRYIRFVDGNIILGEVNNDLMLKISNDKISFLQNGIEVAYMTDNKLYITDGELLNSLQLGKFSFYPRTSGNLSFKKVK